MARLYDKVRAVRKLFGRADREIASFKRKTSLGCPSGCAECCKKENIEATTLEFLPLAYNAYKNGTLCEMIQRVESSTDDGLCPLLDRFISADSPGGCNSYPERGMICRLFGFAATTDKLGRAQLAACRVVKERDPDQYQKIYAEILAGAKAPLFINYYLALYTIDPAMSREYFPLRQAILNALSYVAFYYSFRNRRA
ncbi:MAG: YkgJ family cysteine cluster protein [Candidatus Kapaibacterium sp.]